MTNHWIDVGNSDCILVMGANPAENHPVAFRWILRARERGAKVLCVDPRVTRTAAAADLHVPLRSGTDIAFLGGLIRHVLANDLFDRDAVLRFTDASFLLHEGFGLDVASGLFPGWNEADRRYDRSGWAYEKGADGEPLRDPTLSDPRCVLAVLRA